MKRRGWRLWMPPDARSLIRAAVPTVASDTPRLDAELLLAHVLEQNRGDMLVRNPAVSPDDAARFEALLARRRAHEPIAYILGQQEFWSLNFRVTRDVLIPRADSETLIEAAVARLQGTPPARILDLGTGSGALLLAALSQWPQARGVGVDRSFAAVAVARGNARSLGFAERASFAVGKWADAVRGPFDLILCNPPYIEEAAVLMPDVADFEPAGALFAGPDGLADYRLLFPDVARLLAHHGLAMFEFGAGQEAALVPMAEALGFATGLHRDIAGRPRALALVLGVGLSGLGKAGASR